MSQYIIMTHLLCRISGEDYRLSYSEYYGTAGDALVSANGKPFSTYDKDQDNSILYNCAKLHRVRMIRRSKLPGVMSDSHYTILNRPLFFDHIPGLAFSLEMRGQS